MSVMKYFVVAAGVLLVPISAWADSHATEAEAETEASEIEVTQPIAMKIEADLEAAAKVFQKNCRACHGNKAQGASSYPKLSDKDPVYIAEKLELYRAGTRIGPNSVLMIGAAKKLSDEDIVNLAVYVATAFD